MTITFKGTVKQLTDPTFNGMTLSPMNTSSPSVLAYAKIQLDIDGSVITVPITNSSDLDTVHVGSTFSFTGS